MLMITQAGIYKLTLLENKGIDITYNSSGLITSITNTGDELEFNSDDNEPKYTNEIESAENNDLLNTQKINLVINGFQSSNYDIIEQLKESIYGWIPVIEFMDWQSYVINVPFFAEVDETVVQVSNTFKIQMGTRLKTIKELIEKV